VKPGGAVTFLMSSELYEDFPNPPYIGTTPNSFQFLRPAPKGATFYVGTASYEELIQASEVAIDAATRNGEVGQVAAILAIDCRGRHSIIGPEGLTDTAGLLTRRWGDRVCGIGADGETSATRWRIPLHRNWTFSTLVFGSDLSRRYLFAAERHSFAKLNLEVARGNKARVVYQTIVNIASRLLQVDDCYLWIYDPVRRKLIKEAGAGRWYEQLPTEIDAQLQPGLTSQHAFQEKELKWRSGDEVKQNARTFAPALGMSQQAIEAATLRLKWFVSVPIIDNESTDCLGVLSFASEDPEFIADTKAHVTRAVLDKIEEGSAKVTIRRQRICWNMANAAAAPLRAMHFQSALDRLMREASHASDPEALWNALVNEGVYFLGQSAYLSLLVVDNVKSPSKLICHGISGPVNKPKEWVAVSVDPNAPPEEQGICGCVFKTGKPWPHDDVKTDIARKEADGQNGRPKHKDCLRDSTLEVNYAVPIRGQIDPTRVLGVLNAEAPRDKLNRAHHLPLLIRLAEACGPVIERHFASRDAAIEQQAIRAENEALKKKLEPTKDTKPLYAHLLDMVRAVPRWQFRAACAGLLVLLLLFTSVRAIMEVSSRQRLLMMVDEARDRIRERFVYQNGPSAANASSSAASSGEISQKHLRALDALEVRIHALIATGAESTSDTIESIKDDLQNIQHGDELNLTVGSTPTVEQLRPWVIIPRGSSDFLLAIVVIFCGAIGAFLPQLRRIREPHNVSSRLLFRGLLMGFVALLTLQRWVRICGEWAAVRLPTINELRQC
jgi:hypothetical protein